MKIFIKGSFGGIYEITKRNYEEYLWNYNLKIYNLDTIIQPFKNENYNNKLRRFPFMCINK